MDMPVSRFQNIHEKKKNGVTYTPRDLARFTAQQVLTYFDEKYFVNKKFTILDPSIGNGILVFELLNNLNLENFHEVEVWGIDIDDTSFEEIRLSLKTNFPKVKLLLIKDDFLNFYLENQSIRFDIIIANPPYIRNQIIGGEKSQRISTSFKLKGKIDMYFAFMIAISDLISTHGVSATITSNRFLSIKSGKVLRDHLLNTLDIKSIYDLGDTKIFESVAVLPALVFAKKKNMENSISSPNFYTIYEARSDLNQTFKKVDSIFSELNNSSRYIQVNETKYEIVRGTLDTSKLTNNVWVVSTDCHKNFLETVAANTWKIFKDIGPIRVGVKSTADKVFIRDDWHLFESKPELLKYLLTSKCANQFKAITPKKIKYIVYPHISKNGKQVAVNLNDYPVTKEYLTSHKQDLIKRTYLLKAKRNWYELWVPQKPDLWSKPKIVFPDISEIPKFWLDLNGYIVNGECYWITPDDDNNYEILWLCLAVANSNFIEIFYDFKFNNKLYQNKRRFMKQYVEEFPIPKPDSELSKKLISLSKSLYENTDLEKESYLKDELNKLVFKVFGVTD